MIDKVRPDHYSLPIDVTTFCSENEIGFIEGNIIKYVVRYKKKNGLEDLLKAKEYLNRLIQYVQE